MQGSLFSEISRFPLQNHAEYGIIKKRGLLYFDS